MAQLRIARLVTVFVFVLAGCATAPQQRAERPEKAVAKVMAVSAEAAVRFKDIEAADYVVHAVSDVSGFQFAVIMGKDGARMSEYTCPDISEEQRSMIGTLKRRIQAGEKEFEFHGQGLSVSVVPIERDGSVLGYVAVAAL
jgi:hypothetical protein